MKRKITKVLSFLTIASFLVGCGGNSSDEEVVPNLEPEVVEGKYIVNNSKTDYSVVIPKNANTKEKTAADTLITYLSKSTGAKIGIVNDTDISSGMHYISLGNTSLFAKEFKDVSMSKLDGKISSYFVSTKNENIYIYSNPNERGEGTLYGTFDLLHYLVDYEYYASDEVYFTYKTSVNLLNYKDFFIEPTFDGRSIGNFHLNHNQDVCDNYRIINQYNGTEWYSRTYGHSQVTQFVRPEDKIDGQYIYEIHKDWFSNKTATEAETTNNQLCWSAGEELEDYVAKRFEYFLENNKEATYFMFGQEDNSGWFCECERCQKAIRDYAVNYAGLQIIFMNHVIDKVEKWIDINQPGRQVRYVVFAYYATKVAPCVESNGTWVPANKQVVPNEKLYILYAPITCNFAVPLENQYYNSNTYLEIKQWNAVAGGKVMVYFYDTNFRYYFANFYNFTTVKAMYQTAKEQGVSYMYTQGATDSNTAGFSDMREYIESKLMWNVNLDFDALAKDFIKHYYREASDEIYEYYQTLRDRLAEYHTTHNEGGGIYASIVNSDIYPYSILRYFTNLFDKAMEKIESHKESNPDLYNTLKARIMREYLSVIYLKITLSKAEITNDEKAEMKEIFKTYTGYFSITRENEGGDTVDPDIMFD